MTNKDRQRAAIAASLAALAEVKRQGAPIRPGLYRLSEAARRLNMSEKWMRAHQDEYRVVRLTNSPRAPLAFPVDFIEAIIAGKAQPDPPKAPEPAKPRRVEPKPQTAAPLIDYKEEAA